MKHVIEDNIYGRSPRKLYTVNYNVDGEKCDSVIIENATLTDFINSIKNGISQSEIQDIEDGIDEYRTSKTTDDEKLKCEKKNLENLIDEYYASEDLQMQTYQGTKFWLKVDERNSLLNSITSAAYLGEKNIIIMLSGKPFTFTISAAKKLLYQIQRYVDSCFLQKQNHLSAVDTLATLDDVLKYDYKSGYENKPEL